MSVECKKVIMGIVLATVAMLLLLCAAAPGYAQLTTKLVEGKTLVLPPKTITDGGSVAPLSSLPQLHVCTSTRCTGKRRYELNDHLQNVRAVLSDKRLAGTLGATINSYSSDVVSWTDHYAFGQPLNGRTLSNPSYRYGFNGQEQTDEISGSGNHNTAFYWEYDTRVGRRWNLDPRPNASISGYAAFADNPVYYTDVLGDTVKGDLDAYNKVKAHVAGTIAGFDRQLEDVNRQITERAAAGKKVKKLENQRTNLQRGKASYERVMAEYVALEKSEQVYNVVTGVTDLRPLAGGATAWNPETGYVDVKVNSRFELMESLPHELKHAYQYETGKLSLGSNGDGGGTLYDMQDEIEAYKRSRMFGGYYAGEKIDIAFVKRRGYDLPPTQRTVHTKNTDWEGAASFGDQIKSKIRKAGRNGTTPGELIKGWEIEYEKGKAEAEAAKDKD